MLSLFLCLKRREIVDFCYRAGNALRHTGKNDILEFANERKEATKQ